MEFKIGRYIWESGGVLAVACLRGFILKNDTITVAE